MQSCLKQGEKAALLPILKAITC